MISGLTQMQARLYNLLAHKAEWGEPDVSITQCYSTVYAGTYLSDRREMQQKLGPLISRINAHLRVYEQRIEPGRLKGTYRLNLAFKG